MTMRDRITALAKELDFDHVKFAKIDETPRHAQFEAWLERGEHADMHWMEKNLDVRADPRTRLSGARSVMVLGVPYSSTEDVPAKPGHGRVARYAWGRDYHNFTGKRLKKLRRRLHEMGIESWGGTDTAPILERVWAEAAGLGFIGKNAMSIIPAVGSWYTLAVLFIDVDIDPDPVLADHCGSCTRCVDACPTQAITTEHNVDARRCISYWTIESDDLPPEDIREAMGDRVFGCDICQEVCPHNAGIAPQPHADFAGKNQYLQLSQILESTDEQLLAQFTGSPLRRPKAAGLKRNALLALANHPTPDAAALASRALDHPDQAVRRAAAWAKSQIEQGNSKSKEH
jgi:epoxyqueuosine reductase